MDPKSCLEEAAVTGRAWRARAGQGAPALPALLSLILGVSTVRSKPLWRDEMASWEFSRLPLDGLTRAVQHVDGVFTPYYLLLHGWQLAFPQALALRVPSVLAGAATVGVVATLATRLWDAWAGTVAGAVLATNGTFVLGTATARPYALATLCCAVATWQLVRALDGPDELDRARMRSRVGYGLGMVAAVALQVFAVLILLAHAVVMLASGTRRTSIAGFAFAAGVASALAAAMALAASGQRGQISWIAEPSLRGVRDDLTAALGWPDPWWGLLVVVAAAVTLRPRGRRARRGAVVAIALLLVPATGLMLASVLGQPVFVTRYLLAVPLGAALLFGGVVAVVGSRASPVAALAVLLLVVSVQAPLLCAQFSADTPDDYPRLARRIAAVAVPGDTVVIGQNYNAEGAAVGVAYYLRDRRLVREALRRLPDGSRELLIGRVVSTSPWRSSPRSRPGGRTLLVGLVLGGRNHGHPDGFADLHALGCRQAAPREDVANYGLLLMRCP